MRLGITGVIVACVLVFAGISALAGSVDPPHYFGPGPGYPDYGQNNVFGSGGDKYFYSYYPPEQWGRYGYGTGDAGLGYGPYIYGGRTVPQLAQDRPNFGLPVMNPKLKWIGGNQVRITVPPGPGVVTQLRVEVLAWNGGVIESGIIDCPPYEIIARLPEGATNIRVTMGLADGYSTTVVPLIPVE